MRTIPTIVEVYDDGSPWIATQVALNHLTYKLSNPDGHSDSVTGAGAVPRAVKIRQIVQDLSIGGLLKALQTTTTQVESVSIAWVRFDAEYARELARGLRGVDGSSTIRHLRLYGLVMPEGVEPLCSGLRNNRSLERIELDFTRRLDPTQVISLVDALRTCQNLRAVGLRGVHFAGCPFDVRRHLLGGLIRGNPLMEHLRLSGCMLVSDDIREIALAARETGTVQHLDLSANRISDLVSVLPLLESQSQLRSLVLAGNVIEGGGCKGSKRRKCHERYFKEESLKTVEAVCCALAANATLRILILDFNPLSECFVTRLAVTLERHNTTLQWISVAGALGVSHELQTRIQIVGDQNAAGRGLLRMARSRERDDDDCEEGSRFDVPSATKLVPQILSRVSGKPDLVFGLIKDHPQLYSSYV